MIKNVRTGDKSASIKVAENQIKVIITRNLNFCGFVKPVANYLTSESFAKLLDALSSDQSEAARAYTTLRSSIVRYFQIKGDSFPDEAADTVLDRVAEKLALGLKIDDLTKYSFTVAKFVFLERMRSLKKEKLAADEFYFRNDGRRDGKETDALRPFRECFESLPDDDQKVLTGYFADLPADRLFDFRQKLAEAHEGSLNYLRLRIFRLRKRLDDCVRRRLEK